MKKKEYVLQEYIHKPKQGDTTTLRVSYQDGEDGIFFSLRKGSAAVTIRLNAMEVHDLIHTLEGISSKLRGARVSHLTQRREDYLKKVAQDAAKSHVFVEEYDLSGGVAA
ncbi:MAG: hypothetical protein GXN93_04760 [Candidatus Diapherotrites archaeon]|nr:hypothetical protein [Candidatus Diapherotrites archaeon]